MRYCPARDRAPLKNKRKGWVDVSYYKQATTSVVVKEPRLLFQGSRSTESAAARPSIHERRPTRDFRCDFVVRQISFDFFQGYVE